MNCRYCGRPNAVYISHQESDLFERRRARQCKSCKEVFLTVERPVEDTEVTAEEARRHMDLLTALGKLKVETGSLACMGCGHEHNCDIHGCAIIRAAIKEMKKVEARRTGWIPVKAGLPKIKEHHVSDDVIVYFEDGGMGFSAVVENCFGQTWFECERYNPDEEGPFVTHWMPMPEPPDVSEDG